MALLNLYIFTAYEQQWYYIEGMEHFPLKYIQED